MGRRASTLRKWVRWKRFAVRTRSAAAVDGISWFFGDAGQALRRRVLRARIGIQRRRQRAGPRRGPGGRRLGRMAAVAAFASVLAAMGLMLSGLGAHEDPGSRASAGGGPGSEGTPPPALARDRAEVAGVRTDRRRQRRRRAAPAAQVQRSDSPSRGERSSADKNEPVGSPVSRRRSSAAPTPRPTPVAKPAPRRRVSPPPRQAPPPDNSSGSQPAPPPPPPPPPPAPQSAPEGGHPHGGPPGQEKPRPEEPESEDDDD
jgi:hypothetical protein